MKETIMSRDYIFNYIFEMPFINMLRKVPYTGSSKTHP